MAGQAVSKPKKTSQKKKSTPPPPKSLTEQVNELFPEFEQSLPQDLAQYALAGQLYSASQKIFDFVGLSSVEPTQALQAFQQFEQSKQNLLQSRNKYGVVDFNDDLTPRQFYDSKNFGSMHPKDSINYLEVAGPDTVKNLMAQAKSIAQLYTIPSSARAPIDNFNRDFRVYSKNDQTFNNIDFRSVRSLDDFKTSRWKMARRLKRRSTLGFFEKASSQHLLQ